MSYEQKYVKYKYKYLELKASVGGDPPKSGPKPLPTTPKKATYLDYKSAINEFYNTIHTFIKELSCCGAELNLNKNASNVKQKYFATILEKNYNNMSDPTITTLDSDKESLNEIKLINNSVPVKYLNKYIDESISEPLINCFSIYANFVQKFFTEVSKENIPFYSLHPVPREYHTEPSCQTDKKSMQIKTTISDCYLSTVVAQCMTRISMSLKENMLKQLKSDPDKTDSDLPTEKFIEDFISKLELWIKKINDAVDSVKSYSHDKIYLQIYDEKKYKPEYGMIDIYDANICSNCNDKTCCDRPCKWTKPTLGKTKCVMAK